MAFRISHFLNILLILSLSSALNDSFTIQMQTLSPTLELFLSNTWAHSDTSGKLYYRCFEIDSLGPKNLINSTMVKTRSKRKTEQELMLLQQPTIPKKSRWMFSIMRTGRSLSQLLGLSSSMSLTELRNEFETQSSGRVIVRNLEVFSFIHTLIITGDSSFHRKVKNSGGYIEESSSLFTVW